MYFLVYKWQWWTDVLNLWEVIVCVRIGHETAWGPSFWMLPYVTQCVEVSWWDWELSNRMNIWWNKKRHHLPLLVLLGFRNHVVGHYFYWMLLNDQWDFISAILCIYIPPIFDINSYIAVEIFELAFNSTA